VKLVPPIAGSGSSHVQRTLTYISTYVNIILMNNAVHHEDVPGNSLDWAFSRYVDAAYTNGEFDLPKTALGGRVESDLNSHYTAYSQIRRKLGEATIFEGSTGDSITTDVNHGELVLKEKPTGIEILKRDRPNPNRWQ
jgi:hypothetical protein